jgi:hypothetical protein
VDRVEDELRRRDHAIPRQLPPLAGVDGHADDREARVVALLDVLGPVLRREPHRLARRGDALQRGDLGPATAHLVAVEFTPDLPEYAFVSPEHPLARALRGLAAA